MLEEPSNVRCEESYYQQTENYIWVSNNFPLGFSVSLSVCAPVCNLVGKPPEILCAFDGAPSTEKNPLIRKLLQY